MDNSSQKRIQDKAAEVFLRYGIRSISMDDIAGSLGMSKKTIYQYFADKDTLVEATVREHVRRTEALIREMSLAASDAVEEIFRTMALAELQFRNMNPIVLHDMQKFHPRAFERINEHKYGFLLQVIRDNMQRGIREGLYRSELDVEVLSLFRLESMMVLFNVELFPPTRFNLADVSNRVLEHFLFGLATEKGYELIRRYKSASAVNKQETSEI